MAINGIGGSGFNPYANGIGGSRNVNNTTSATQTPATSALPTQRPAAAPANGAAPKSIADAIKNDAAARAEQVNSSKAPDGVDQELWSVLSKEERSFFVKAGAMGPLTYGRFTQQAPQQSVSAPIMRGGRLDIKA
jgi:hypothetical protein